MGRVIGDGRAAVLWLGGGWKWGMGTWRRRCGGRIVGEASSELGLVVGEDLVCFAPCEAGPGHWINGHLRHVSFACVEGEREGRAGTYQKTQPRRSLQEPRRI